MATYPSFQQIIGSEITFLDGKVVNRSVSGKPRIRSYYSETRRDIRVVHDLNQSDANTVMTFYDNNRDIVFDVLFQADGVTYTCYFAGVPRIRPTGGGYFEVIVEMVQA